MPLYEFGCVHEGCEKVNVEKFFHAHELPTPLCPKCKGPMYRRISAPNAHFKGEGFYATEHGNQKHNRGRRKR